MDFSGIDSIDLCWPLPHLFYSILHSDHSYWNRTHQSPHLPSPEAKQRSRGLTFTPGVQPNYRWRRSGFRKVCIISWSLCPYLKCLNNHLLKRKLINSSGWWPTKPLLSWSVRKTLKSEWINEDSKVTSYTNALQKHILDALTLFLKDGFDLLNFLKIHFIKCLLNLFCSSLKGIFWVQYKFNSINTICGMIFTTKITCPSFYFIFILFKEQKSGLHWGNYNGTEWGQSINVKSISTQL